VSAINNEIDNLLSLFKNGEIIIIAPSRPAERLIKRSEIEEIIAVFKLEGIRKIIPNLRKEGRIR